MRAWIIRGGLVGALGLGPVVSAALAEEPARTIIVMDGSGSMWGQIDGRPKLEIAREAVARVVAELPAGQALGLIAYGHRSKGDCSDIETLVAPRVGSGPEVSAAVGSMRFLGKTPLSDAVLRAAETLRYTETAANVVLVTDGLETCGGDPCALGAALEAAGANFTAHVVGFGLSAAEGAEVACLAEATGGRYLEAHDAASLGAALAETVVAPAPEPAPAAPAVPGVMLFAEPGFAGESYFLDRDTADFTRVLRPDGQSLNDWARSARVVGEWELCRDIYFLGGCQRIAGEVPDLGGIGLSSSALRAVGTTAAPLSGAQDAIDMPGGDYASFGFDAPGAVWSDCAAVCAADDPCAAWTFVRPQDGGLGACYLKDSAPGPVPGAYCVSGLRSAMTAAAEPAVAPAVTLQLEPATGGHAIAISWSAVPAPGQDVPPEAWALPEAVTGPVAAEFLPGVYDVRGEGGDTVFAARITVTGAAGQRFVIPVDAAASPAGPDATLPERLRGKAIDLGGRSAAEVLDALFKQE